MSSKAEHCQDCIDEIGQPFEEVHVWLDEFFPIVGPEHRLIRHHRMGIEKARGIWGDDGARAAEIHILKDEGRIPIYDLPFQLMLAFSPEVQKIFDTQGYDI